jgi:xylan 1,4-beta-xylosidase
MARSPFAGCFLLLATAALLSSQESFETGEIAVNAQAPSGPFPHYWEQMFGSGRAATGGTCGP